ncbi:ribonuclease III [Buchananella hordeovulneris]|nr:ribonuclease III [Buchananella hordeovulneris]
MSRLRPAVGRAARRPRPQRHRSAVGRPGRAADAPGGQVNGAKRIDLGALLERWGTSIDGELLVLALTHRSFANTVGGPHNERLEFLGDSVLSLVAADYFYREQPGLAEGQISRLHHATVSEPTLAALARRLDLGDYLLLDQAADGYGARAQDSVLADAVEALIGATYLCHGYDATARVVRSLLDEVFADAPRLAFLQDPKTPLQEWAVKHGYSHPVYASQHTGPDHARVFAATVSLDGKVYGRGSGTSRKAAEVQAAAEACARLGVDGK